MKDKSKYQLIGVLFWSSLAVIGLIAVYAICRGC